MKPSTKNLPDWAVRRSAEWLALWGVPDVQNQVTIELSARMTRSLGRCYPQRGIVRLAASLVDGPRDIFEEALCHELAHVVAFQQNGRNGRPHGRQWAELMQQAGFEPRARLRWGDAPPTKRRKRRRHYIYMHVCPVCQARRTARRAVRQWRCTACVEAGLDGELEIWRRPARFYERR